MREEGMQAVVGAWQLWIQGLGATQWLGDRCPRAEHGWPRGTGAQRL